MDKNTLSNYGWIVIAVLVLSVMIALATPFGTYIENGVRSTTEGLFNTSQNAMNTAFADLGVQMDDQTFEEGYTGVGNSGGTGTETPSEPGEPVTPDRDGYISGVWVFNETHSGIALYDQDVNFTSNGETFTYIHTSDFPNANARVAHTAGHINYNQTRVYDGYENTWVNEAYRTIDFGTTPQPVSEEFYNWFTTNAVEASPTPVLITFTIDGVEYQAESDMSWEKFISSKYNINNFTSYTGMKGTYINCGEATSGNMMADWKALVYENNDSVLIAETVRANYAYKTQERSNVQSGGAN